MIGKMAASVPIIVLFISLGTSHVCALPKIVFLHGGGQSANAMRADSGVQALVRTLSSDYEFVFAQTPESTGNWIRDPPGGKGAATTDPNFADNSVNYMNTLNTTDGPFVGIAGYSQGSAFSTYYLARLMADYGDTRSINFAMLFCGYLPTTHAGLVTTIDAQSPFDNIPALIFMGQQDYWITNEMTNTQAAKFANPTRVTGAATGHNVPAPSDAPALEAVVAFALAQSSTSNNTRNATDMVFVSSALTPTAHGLIMAVAVSLLL